MSPAAHLILIVSCLVPLAALADKPLSPVEARNRVNEEITVEMFVRASKNQIGRAHV